MTRLNKPVKPEHLLVMAENEEDAKQQAKNQIQKKTPSGSVTIGTVRE